MAVPLIVSLPLTSITPGMNDRANFDAEDLSALMASIAKDGLIQPINVRPNGHGFEIIAGERRYRAVSALGLSHINAIVNDASDERVDRMMLSENMIRTQLDPMEEAFAFRRRLDAGTPIDEVAAMAGVKPGHISWRLRLLELLPEIQHMVARRQIKVTAAATMAGLDGNRQIIAVRALTAQELNIEQFRALCARLLSEQNQEQLDLFGFVNPTWQPKHRAGSRPSIRKVLTGLVAAIDEKDRKKIAELVEQARFALNPPRKV